MNFLVSLNFINKRNKWQLRLIGSVKFSYVLSLKIKYAIEPITKQ